MRQKKVGLTKIKGTVNPADMMTKFLGSAALSAMMRRLGFEVLDGRAALASQMAKYDEWQEELEGATENSVDQLVVADVDRLQVFDNAESGSQEGKLDAGLGGCELRSGAQRSTEVVPGN